MREKMKEKIVRWTITKYRNDMEHADANPYEISIIDGNVLLNTGINELWKLACDNDGTFFSADNAFLCVGDDDTPADAEQVGPLSSTAVYKGMDTGFPESGTDQLAAWQAVFQWNEANFAWNEFLVANGNDADAVHLNRKVSDEGTKPSGEVWVLRLEIVME